MHRLTDALMFKCASTVATMDDHDFFCLPNIYSFTNFFVGRFIDTNEAFFPPRRAQLWQSSVHGFGIYNF